MTRRRFLVTFATPDFEAERDALVASAHRSRQFAEVFAWDEKGLRSDPVVGNDPLLDEPGGFRLFSWKPRIVLDALEAVDDGDVVVYSDVGRYRGGYTVERDLSPLVEFCERNHGCLPGVLVPNFGPTSRWTRRDCFVLMDCDSPYFWERPQVQATFSVWIKSDLTTRLVSEWAAYCSDLRIIGNGPNACGLPNLPGFVAHRHDQSVLTNLVAARRIAPFRVESALFERVVALRPHSLSASLVVKNIDNVTAIADGAHPVHILARELLRSRFLG